MSRTITPKLADTSLPLPQYIENRFKIITGGEHCLYKDDTTRSQMMMLVAAQFDETKRGELAFWDPHADREFALTAALMGLTKGDYHAFLATYGSHACVRNDIYEQAASFIKSMLLPTEKIPEVAQIKDNLPHSPREAAPQPLPLPKTQNPAPRHSSAHTTEEYVKDWLSKNSGPGERFRNPAAFIALVRATAKEYGEPPEALLNLTVNGGTQRQGKLLTAILGLDPGLAKGFCSMIRLEAKIKGLRRTYPDTHLEYEELRRNIDTNLLPIANRESLEHDSTWGDRVTNNGQPTPPSSSFAK